MSNNRIYYASQTIQLRPQEATPASSSDVFSGWYQPLGLQSVGMTTNFALEQAFQLGTVELYDNVETTPEVEVTISRTIDTTAPLYLMCMGGKDGVDGAVGKPIVALANNRVNFRLGIYEDSNQFISGNASQHVVCSGMYLSSFKYTFPVDGNATEEVTLVGNHKIWNTGVFLGDNSYTFNAGNVFNPNTRVGNITPTSASGILRRQYFNIIDSVLPIGSGGIKKPNSTGADQVGGQLPHIQNITVSADLGRESINQLGKFAPYCRYTTFPIEVTSEFEVISPDGDYVDAKDFMNESFCNGRKTNLIPHTIVLAVCDMDNTNSNNTMQFNLGNKNTLTSVNHTGGDTGGGNVTVTYSFRNFNNFSISANGTYADGLKLAAGTASMQSIPGAAVDSGPVSTPDFSRYLNTNLDNNPGDL